MASGEEQTPRGSKKHITAFFVDKGTPGFHVRNGCSNVSHRGQKLHGGARRLPSVSERPAVTNLDSNIFGWEGDFEGTREQKTKYITATPNVLLRRASMYDGTIRCRG